MNIGSAYDLYLTRNLKNATLVRGDGVKGPDAFDIFVKDKLDAVAGVRQMLAAYAATHPGMRVMDDRFMDIRQAMGTPQGPSGRRRLPQGIRRGDEGIGLCRRGAQAQRAVGKVAPPA